MERMAHYNRRNAYISGTAALKEQPVRREGRRPVRQANAQAAKAEKLSYITVIYMVFLTAATCLLLVSGIHYLQLQAENTSVAKHIAAMEMQLEELKKENNDNYTRIQTSVDLDYIKEVAINELGMVYASADQVILYDGGTRDYVRQTAEIPKDSAGTGLFSGK